MAKQDLFRHFFVKSQLSSTKKLQPALERFSGIKTPHFLLKTDLST